MLLKVVSLIYIHFFFYFNILYNVIFSSDGKADFSLLLFKSPVSHDSSEIILIY